MMIILEGVMDFTSLYNTMGEEIKQNVSMTSYKKVSIAFVGLHYLLLEDLEVVIELCFLSFQFGFQRIYLSFVLSL